MKTWKTLFAVLMLLTLILSACEGQQPAPTEADQSSVQQPTEPAAAT